MIVALAPLTEPEDWIVSPIELLCTRTRSGVCLRKAIA